MTTQPTNIESLTDLAEVTGVTDVVIAGTTLGVTPGVTPSGRFWALLTPDTRTAGLVVEHDGGLFEAVIGKTIANAATAQDAALLIVAALHAPTPKDGAR